ncbi:TetR/AcrR family transcriptional regulator [Ramlibacter montanisoli]|uniref:TetR/AcrR family transcriptional regulator n=1 Tax=Ramlibacter montanisoli TaxID=2732512 RepID=A0A849K1R6_9BURK|nr:TetR/AcrR family transcriptional regulator [Ramlibacter montanisoli]NNU42448.1 TetR/AcrR family transcriptional regulator [Ramlibacter montanisoli]
MLPACQYHQNVIHAFNCHPSHPGCRHGPARGDTKARILEAAYQRLAREGYAALSVREIARDAGVNFALINYHFASKDKLVLAVLDEANRRLLERQQRMYRSGGGYAEKWAQARRFYENDLASGFVRVLMELYAASMSNPSLREEFRPRINAWFDVIGQVVREAVAEYRLDLPVPPEVIGCWISNFWMGMELAMLAGTGDAKLHLQSLDAMEAILRKLDDAHRPAPARRAVKPRKPATRPS